MALEHKLGKIVDQLLGAVSNGEELAAVYRDIEIFKEDILNSGAEVSDSGKRTNDELETRVQELRKKVRENKILLRSFQESLSLITGKN